MLILRTAYIATLNLPDTLNFELAEEDAAKLYPTDNPGSPSRSGTRQSAPKPNLLESLSKNASSSPPTVASSLTTEFPPGGSRRAKFFASVTSALANLDPDIETRPHLRRKLTQPPSHATSPLLPRVEPPHINYGLAASPSCTRKRDLTVGQNLFVNAKWTAEKQQFDVNGELINAVKSAQNAE